MTEIDTYREQRKSLVDINSYEISEASSMKRQLKFLYSCIFHLSISWFLNYFSSNSCVFTVIRRFYTVFMSLRSNFFFSHILRQKTKRIRTHSNSIWYVSTLYLSLILIKNHHIVEIIIWTNCFSYAMKTIDRWNLVQENQCFFGTRNDDYGHIYVKLYSVYYVIDWLNLCSTQNHTWNHLHVGF